MVAIMVSGKSEGGFRGLEPGIYKGRCDLIADLGTQETKFGDKHKIYIRYTVPDQVVETSEGEKFQMSIGSTFTASLSKKANLRKMLEAWRGRPFTEEELAGFDLSKLLGVPATLVVSSYLKDGEERSSLENVLRCKDEVGELIRKPASFGLDSSDAELDEAPPWIKEKILDQRGTKAGNPADEELERQYEAHQAAEDDIPFE
jgi:hypothetical protein